MAKIEIRNLQNQPVGVLELDDRIFAAPVNEPLIHQVIKAQLAGKRQGTAKTKTKAEVRGGGRKPYKQKGTGNARLGSTRSPLRVGGGQTFGPIPRSYVQATPKEMMKGALRSALADRFAANRIIVVDEFALKTHKTQPFVKILKDAFKVDQVLIVDEVNDLLKCSSRNIPRVKVIQSEGLNVYDIIRNDWIMMSKRSVELIQERL